MSAPTWTAGPWRTHATGWVVAVCGSPPGCVVWADSDAPSVETIRANVSLIAAAPDLYAELDRQVRNCGVCKGEGVSIPFMQLCLAPDPQSLTKEPCPKCTSSRLALSKARGEPTPSEGEG